MSKENVKENVVPMSLLSEVNENEEVKNVKTRKKIHFQSPFRMETVEVPAKPKKEKKAKEPKKEKDPNKKKFGTGFGLGFAAGVPVGAAAGFFGIGARKASESDISEDDEDELEDLEDEDGVPSESSETE